MSKFGFDVYKIGDLTWYVELPHQCDSWDIAMGDQMEALHQLNVFITEAIAARDALASGREEKYRWSREQGGYVKVK